MCWTHPFPVEESSGSWWFFPFEVVCNGLKTSTLSPGFVTCSTCFTVLGTVGGYFNTPPTPVLHTPSFLELKWVKSSLKSQVWVLSCLYTEEGQRMSRAGNHSEGEWWREVNLKSCYRPTVEPDHVTRALCFGWLNTRRIAASAADSVYTPAGPREGRHIVQPGSSVWDGPAFLAANRRWCSKTRNWPISWSPHSSSFVWRAWSELRSLRLQIPVQSLSDSWLKSSSVAAHDADSVRQRIKASDQFSAQQSCSSVGGFTKP